MSDEYRALSRNAVLLRDEVGKAKPTYYDLPPPDHAFGRAEPPDMEGAREVTMNWAAHVPRAKSSSNVQDYQKLNSLAAAQGVTSSKQLKHWKKNKDIKLVPKAAEGASPCVIPSDILPAFAYGNKSRPSTPIDRVVGNLYGLEQEEANRALYQQRAESNPSNGRRIIKLTMKAKMEIKNAKERRAQADNPPEPKAPWTMSKFKKVQASMSPEEMGRAPRRTNSMPSLPAC